MHTSAEQMRSMLPACSSESVPSISVNRGSCSDPDTLSLSSLDLADEESWLYKSPNRQLVNTERTVNNPTNSAIEWMRQDFDKPSRELVSARRSLFKQLTTLANQTTSSRDTKSERISKRRSLCEDELDYKLSDVTDVQIMARLQEDKLRQSMMKHEVSADKKQQSRNPSNSNHDDMVQRSHSLDRRHLKTRARRNRSSSIERSHSRERYHDDSSDHNDRFHDDAYYSEESNSGGCHSEGGKRNSGHRATPSDSDENIPPPIPRRVRNRSGSSEHIRSTSQERIHTYSHSTFDRNDSRRHTYASPRHRTQSHDPREKSIKPAINSSTKQVAPRQVLSMSPDPRQMLSHHHNEPHTLTDLRNLSLNEEPEPLRSPQQRHQILFQKAKQNRVKHVKPVISDPVLHADQPQQQQQPMQTNPTASSAICSTSQVPNTDRKEPIVLPAASSMCSPSRVPDTHLKQLVVLPAASNICSPSQIPDRDRKQPVVLPAASSGIPVRGSGIPVRQRSSIPRPVPSSASGVGVEANSNAGLLYAHLPQSKLTNSKGHRRSLPVTPSMNLYATYTKKTKNKRPSVCSRVLISQDTALGLYQHKLPYSTPCSDADDDEYY